jgi:colicin import membrane protein
MEAMVMGPAPADPARVPAAVLAVLVHLLLFAFLFFGVRWSTTAPEAVVVELWTQPPQPVVAPAEPAPPPPPPPKVEPEPPRPVVKPAPPKPAPEVRKPDIALEKDKQAKKPPPKPEAKPEARPAPKAETRPEPKLELDVRARMQEQLVRESKALADDRAKRESQKPAAAPPPAAPSIDSGYAARIRGKIHGNIVMPQDIIGNPEAIFDVVQLPDGVVLKVSLRKSSGHKGYDDAIERAILKSSPLPKPDRMDQFQRQLELKFRPKDPL